MVFRAVFAIVVILREVDPVLIVEKTCYRRIITGKRLHERFIRHSLPCNSLQACQHQCSIEKHFACEGFNIRLDPARVGRGICELSSVSTGLLDLSRDFVFDPEFAYYERDHNNGSPNCGIFTQVPNAVAPHNTEENTIGYQPPLSGGGPYYGGDSYGPWSTGHGTVEHGPWGSHGYGSGFYESNNPSRGPPPSFRPDTPPQQGYGRGSEFQGTGGPGSFHPGPSFPGYGPPRSPGISFRPSRPGYRPDYQGSKPTWGPLGDRRYDKPNRIPTYIIIDADVRRGYGGTRPNYQPYRPKAGYLPVPPPPLPRPQPLPLPPPPRSPSFGISTNTITREVCFRREHPGYKLTPDTIRGMYETPTVLDCEAMCINSPFKCTGYSFRYSSVGKGPNCLLTDYATLNPQTHLLPDRSCDVYFKMGTCMEFDRTGDTECFLKVASNRKLDPSKLMKMLSVSGMSDCELACLAAGFFTCRSFSYRHGPPVIGEPVENCFLSDWPMSALTHLDLVPAGNHEVYERGSFGHGCELDLGPPHIGPKPPFASYPNIPQISYAKDPWALTDTWRHFTVNGWPCRTGTECELNPLAGFWACQVEGGDHAQWDYCCRPKHPCGFSRGYYYPWCYVGEAGPDQWRPCSEFYYPDSGNRYPYKPVQSHTPHPADSYGPHRDTRPWNFGEEDFGPPAYWPISYIYSEPPPNETYVWNPEEHHFEHYRLEEESPRIRFKPCGQRHPYPRAIIQKLDFKNIPKAGNPEEQSKRDEKPRSPKPEAEPSAENRDKKNSGDFFPSVAPPRGNVTNETIASPDKAKELIKTVDKIIMDSSRGAEAEKNESLKREETGYLSVSLLEQGDL